MKDEAATLRRELGRVRTRRGACFRWELRERATAWLITERAAGRSIATLAAELGIARGTVIRWSSSRGSRTGPRSMVPVHVVAKPAPQRVVRVVSPGGFAIEGVTVAEAAAVLRELG